MRALSNERKQTDYVDHILGKRMRHTCVVVLSKMEEDGKLGEKNCWTK